MRRQEVVENIVRCFGYGEEGHKKWECPKKKKRSKNKEAAPPSVMNRQIPLSQYLYFFSFSFLLIM